MSDGKTIVVASSDDGGLEGRISTHFGCCAALVVVKTAGTEIAGASVVPTPPAEQHAHGAKPALARRLGADVVISGGLGPRAVERLGEFGIETVTAGDVTVREAVEAYLRGELRGVEACSHEGGGCGPGRGGGRRGAAS